MKNSASFDTKIASIPIFSTFGLFLMFNSYTRLEFLPPYSPDLNPVEGVFSQIKSMMKDCRDLFEVTTSPRALLALLFGSISVADCRGHIAHSGYIN